MKLAFSFHNQILQRSKTGSNPFHCSTYTIELASSFHNQILLRSKTGSNPFQCSTYTISCSTCTLSILQTQTNHSSFLFVLLDWRVTFKVKNSVEHHVCTLSSF
ncbi:hypothetical protein EGW08_003325 [Elysia chlorotica]|uniref:Uncharacterized protein n=1 Tax=Elysia chlorotica TaxID=188477 RepID=A0A433U4Y7_ELYCH|nr:hypothetical protein EGW08_003325 [Elysia chlorotica]